MRCSQQLCPLPLLTPLALEPVLATCCFWDLAHSWGREAGSLLHWLLWLWLALCCVSWDQRGLQKSSGRDTADL